MAGLLDMKDGSQRVNESGPDLLSQIYFLICAIAPCHRRGDFRSHRLHSGLIRMLHRESDFQSELRMLLKQVFSLRLAFNGYAGTQINLQHLAFVRDELSSYKLRPQSANNFKNQTLPRAQHILEKLHQELLQENNKSFIFVQPSYKVRFAPIYPSRAYLSWPDKIGSGISKRTSSLQEQKLLRLSSPFLDLDDSIKHFLSEPPRAHRILGIFGQGGIGKTTLLLNILQMLHSQKAFSLIVYVELRDEQYSHKAMMEAQISVLLQLGGSVDDISDGSSAQQALLCRFEELAAADESVCIAFDNAVHLERLLEYWIPLGESSLMSCVMVTSRKAIDLEMSLPSREDNIASEAVAQAGSRALTLEQKPLPPETARDLLLAYAGIKGRQLAEHHEVKLVDEIYPLCGGIPLAVKFVGSLLAHVRDLEFWEGWMSKMKGSFGFPFADEFKLTGILERSYQHLDTCSQEALLDIATFLHGWNWDTVESILGFGEMCELKNFFLIYRTNQEFVSSDISNVYAEPANVIMHDLMRKLVVEKMGKTCLVLGNQEECSTLLLSNESVLSGVRCLRVNIEAGVEISSQSDAEGSSSSLSLDGNRFCLMQSLRVLDLSGSLNKCSELRFPIESLRYLRLANTSACSVSLDGNDFSLMQSLRLLDLSGSFKCSELRLPESLRYLRLANTDGLVNQLTKAKIPSNLWHFEVEQCEGLMDLPPSIYLCKDLGSLKLSDCPHLQGFRAYSNWKLLKELHMKGCHGITQLPLDLHDYLNAVTLNDCPNLQALPPNFSKRLRNVKIQGCPYLSAGLDVANSTPTSKAADTTVTDPINLQSTLQNSPADQGRVMPVHECGKTWKLSLTSAVQLRLQDCDCIELKASGFEDMKNLQKLKLENCQRLVRLPDSICTLNSLVVLDLHGCSELKELPGKIGNLSALEVLDLNECRKLKCLPYTTSDLKSLKELNLCGCAELDFLSYDLFEKFSALNILRLANCQSITWLDNDIFSSKSLVHLDLHGCSKLGKLPEQIGRLSALKTLFLMECHSIKTLPSSISDLQSLQVLSINGCSQIKELPEQMQSLGALTVFSAANCGSLQRLCKSMCELQSLSVLDLQGCLKLEELPKEFGYNLRSLTSLLLMECQSLKSLPEGICRMPLLEELDLSGCLALGRLPEEMGNLRALRKLRLANCESLQRLPDSICHLQSLVNLDLHGCYKLQELPRDFGKLNALETLNLLKCLSLQLLPESIMCGLESLKELDMRGSLVEQILQRENSYFVGCEKARRFLSFLMSDHELEGA